MFGPTKCDRNHLSIERVVLLFEVSVFAIEQLLRVVDTPVYSGVC
jgi:hypothetical protein